MRGLKLLLTNMYRLNFLLITLFFISNFSFSQDNIYTDEHDDGTYSKGIYVDGLKQGEWIKYYSSGKKFIVANYINDTLEGSVKSYYKNGSIQAENNYLKGKLNGISKQFDIKGKPIREISYQNNLIFGNCIYYENGIIYNEQYYKNGIPNGPGKEYDEKGNLQYEYILLANNQRTNSVCYNKNGKKVPCNFF